jgi:hypothetical protein
VQASSCEDQRSSGLVVQPMSVIDDRQDRIPIAGLAEKGEYPE